MSLLENKKGALGYACLNVTLGNRHPKVVCNRGMRKATFIQKGLPYVSDLAMQNLQALYSIVQWNGDVGIFLYRMSSDIFPWMSEYTFSDLPRFESLKKQLKAIGQLAVKTNLRMTFHPGQYDVLASQSPRVVENTITDLNRHAEIMDMLGLTQSHFNKINIHVGTAQGGKKETLKRFCTNFSYLSESAQKRLTVENDDKAALFTVEDLAEGVYERIGIPVVLDTHHHYIHHEQSLERSFAVAMNTWPEGVRPLIHVSEPKVWYDDAPGIRIQAHADYVQREIITYGYTCDVMLEAKAKELAVLAYKKQYPGQFL